jgi:hypothetical protein
VGGSLNVNTLNAALGQVGLVVALSPGSVFTAGSQQVAQLHYTLGPLVTNGAPVAFADSPVVKETSDVAAGVLPTQYSDALLNISAPPILAIMPEPGGIQLSWPVSGGSFALQTKVLLEASTWDYVNATITTNGGVVMVTLPITDTQRFYRLQQQ